MEDGVGGGGGGLAQGLGLWGPRSWDFGGLGPSDQRVLGPEQASSLGEGLPEGSTAQRAWLLGGLRTQSRAPG